MIFRFFPFLLPGCARLRAHYPPRPVEASIQRPILVGPPPRISVVVPSYNQGRYLVATLDSLVSQEYPNLEIIVVDGGSSDDSVEVIRRFESSIAWWVSEPDGGQANALNKGFARSTGDVMAWLNSDDCFTPNALWVVADLFNRHRDIDVLYSHRILIDMQGRDIGRWILPSHDAKLTRWADFVPQETMFWRRDIWEGVGAGIDEDFHFALDWELILRFMDAGARLVRVPYFLGMFRLHDVQKTHVQMSGVGSLEIDRLRARFDRSQLPARLRRWKHQWLVVRYLLSARLLDLLWKRGLVRYD